MDQLIVPNLDVTYRGGWCQKAVENTVGEDGVYPSAYKSWLANAQHRESPPAGRYVPVYLSMPNGPKDPDGTQQGDVAISCPDGTVAAAALSGTNRGLFKYPSLQAYITDYANNNGGATYIGYGEYIGRKQVIKEIQMPDTAGVINQWKAFGKGEPSQEQINYYTARPWNVLNEDLLVWNRDERQRLQKIVDASTGTYKPVTETLYKKEK